MERSDFERVFGVQNRRREFFNDRLRRAWFQSNRRPLQKAKEQQAETYEPGRFDDRNTHLLRAFRGETLQKIVPRIPQRHRDIRKPQDPFPSPLFNEIPPPEEQARKQQRRVPADQSIPRFDPNDQHAGLDPSSNFGFADTIPIVLRQQIDPRKPDVPVWSRDPAFDV